MQTIPFSPVPLQPEDDAALADLIRYCLKEHDLDKPGTVYFDPELDHLSAFYQSPDQTSGYWLLKDGGRLAGSVGFCRFEGLDNTAELQKIYLHPDYRRQGLGKKLLEFAEQKCRQAGYEQMYLETHPNLNSAICMYEGAGYRMIDRPECVMHSAMTVFMTKNL